MLGYGHISWIRLNGEQHPQLFLVRLITVLLRHQHASVSPGRHVEQAAGPHPPCFLLSRWQFAYSQIPRRCCCYCSKDHMWEPLSHGATETGKQKLCFLDFLAAKDLNVTLVFSIRCHRLWFWEWTKGRSKFHVFWLLSAGKQIYRELRFSTGTFLCPASNRSGIWGLRALCGGGSSGSSHRRGPTSASYSLECSFSPESPTMAPQVLDFWLGRGGSSPGKSMPRVLGVTLKGPV